MNVADKLSNGASFVRISDSETLSETDLAELAATNKSMPTYVHSSASELQELCDWLSLIKDLTVWAPQIENHTKYICLDCWAVTPELESCREKKHRRTPNIGKMARAVKDKYVAMAKSCGRVTGDNI